MKAVYVLLCLSAFSSCTTRYEVVNSDLPRLKTVGDDFTCEEKVKIYEYEINRYNSYIDDLD